MKGIDYSWSRPGGAAIKAAGFTFAMRYVPYPGDSGKGLTLEEIADLHGHGISIALVFESTAGRALEGYSAGTMDAQTCMTATRVLGLPDMPFYFAVDFNATSGQLVGVDDYLSGAAAVLGADRVGVYGSYRVVEHCWDILSARWWWQTYAWSGGNRSAHAHVYQYSNGETLNGGAVDYNEAIDGYFGQWPSPTPEPTPEEDPDMGVTEAQVKEMIDKAIASQFVTYMRLAVGLNDPGTVGFDEAETARLREVWDKLRSTIPAGSGITKEELTIMFEDLTRATRDYGSAIQQIIRGRLG